MSCLMIFGKKYMDEDLGLNELVKETMFIAARPNLGDYIPFLGVFDLQGLSRRMKELSKPFDEFLERVINEHLHKVNEQNQAKDIVDKLMGIMNSNEAVFEFNHHHVKAILLAIYYSNSTDTSSTTVEWILSEVLRHPDVMKKHQNDIERVMVIKEGFRLHLVAPLLIPHESVEDLINVWAIGRDPNVWPEPENFKLERFLECNIDLRGHDFQLLPFGSGRRSCPVMQLGLTIF
uniref:Cytochrome P450 n=1 Tax=Solanum lycopersicum TaxID=4081 RepID=A0A3Q7G3A8_SOLLC